MKRECTVARPACCASTSAAAASAGAATSAVDGSGALAHEACHRRLLLDRKAAEAWDGDDFDAPPPSSAPALTEAYGKEPTQVGDLRLPAGPGPHPVVIVIHGGCWWKGFATRQNTAALASRLTEKGFATWNIELDDLVITEVPRTGWMVASHEAESVALDLTLTPELIAAGNVREVIRFIQERRKSDGLDISDRINVKWNATDEMAAAIESDLGHISDEVLALSMTRDAGLVITDSEIGVEVVLVKA